MLKDDSQQEVWERHARSAWNSFRGQEAVKEALEERHMLMEDPLEQKKMPNLYYVACLEFAPKSSVGKRKC